MIPDSRVAKVLVVRRKLAHRSTTWCDDLVRHVIIALLLWLGIFAVSCSDEPTARSQLGDGCKLNGDCNAGLVCVYGVCNEECNTSQDCPRGRCVLGVDKIRLCQPGGRAACEFHSDCDEPLVCGIDGMCRNECSADRDCVPGQVCTTATCAEPSELSAGGKLDPAGRDPVGKRCVYASDCPLSLEGLTLECRQGACGYACFEERDCGRFLQLHHRRRSGCAGRLCSHRCARKLVLRSGRAGLGSDVRMPGRRRSGAAVQG